MDPNPDLNSTLNKPAMISAAFPAPPPFYTSFTPGNLALLAAHQDEERRHDAPLAQSVTSLPEEVRHLIPPPRPRDGKYRSFGVVHDVCQHLLVPLPHKTNPVAPIFQISLPPAPPSSEPSSLQQSHQPQQSQSQPPTPQRLLAITHNILLTFLALTHAFASAPSTYPPIWDQLHALFQEAHGVVNDYRPHQARETLIAMMEAQVAKGRDEGRGAREMGARVKAVLDGLGGGGDVAVEDSQDVGLVIGRQEHGVRGEEREEDEETKRIWETVGGEVGFV